MRSLCICCDNHLITNSKVIMGSYVLVECENCGYKSVDRFPSAGDLEISYQDFNAGEISRTNYREYVANAERALSNDISLCGLSPTEVESLFDYGCGGGHYVRAAENMGIDACGFDLDRENEHFGAARGVKIFGGNFQDIRDQLGVKKFDIVMSSHVLEHVLNPAVMIEEMKGLMKDDGFIILRTPDQSSIPSNLKIFLRSLGMKKYEYGFLQPPIHLHGFTPCAISKLLLKANLKPLHIQRTSPLSNEAFPSSKNYWSNLKLQKLVYQIGRTLHSGGHLLSVSKKI